MFRRKLLEGERLLLVEKRQGRLNTAIHMMAVFVPLGILWIDERHRIVDVRLARPWRIYLPKAPAKYVLEGDHIILESHHIGDELDFSEIEQSLG
jgi:hypothetical protein